MLYKLVCVTCGEELKPIRATSEEELLYPDFDEIEKHFSGAVEYIVRAFYDEHQAHQLDAVED